MYCQETDLHCSCVLLLLVSTFLQTTPLSSRPWCRSQRRRRQSHPSWLSFNWIRMLFRTRSTHLHRGWKRLPLQDCTRNCTEELTTVWSPRRLLLSFAFHLSFPVLSEQNIRIIRSCLINILTGLVVVLGGLGIDPKEAPPVPDVQSALSPTDPKERPLVAGPVGSTANQDKSTEGTNAAAGPPSNAHKQKKTKEKTKTKASKEPPASKPKTPRTNKKVCVHGHSLHIASRR